MASAGCGQHWGPSRDHTASAILNDLHVSERHTLRPVSSAGAFEQFAFCGTPTSCIDDTKRTEAGHRRPAAPVPQATPTVGGMAAKSEPADIDAVELLDDSTARLARRLVAANANDADECRSFLSMLGIGLAQLA